MCACVIKTALSERGLNGGSSQLRSRNSFSPWNRPQSTSTRALLVWTRYFDPVTVPTPPQNSILDNSSPPESDPCGICSGSQPDNLLRSVFHSVSHCKVKT